ncbi:MAG: hypothetical protein AAF902_23015 [Chloroflexota bacterium]
MSTYDNIQQKLLGLVFILAPLLMVIGTAAFAMGIGVSPSGQSSWVMSVFNSWGYLLMIPVVLTLARILGQRAPFLGLICVILGIGWGMSVVPGTAGSLQTGVDVSDFSGNIHTIMDASQGIMYFLFPSFLSVNGFILLGIGLLWKGGIPRWAAGLLIVGTVLFMVGVSLDAETEVWQASLPGYISYLIALAPLGFQRLVGTNEVAVRELAKV